MLSYYFSLFIKWKHVFKTFKGDSSTNELADHLQPKTVNAFQRVKIDEVEFVDERLQDNSYWAKVC